MSSTTGTVTPAAHNDHVGRKVSRYGRNQRCAWPMGVRVNTLCIPAMKKINPNTSRANRTAQAREASDACIDSSLLRPGLRESARRGVPSLQIH